MKTCIWYHTAERQPDNSGYYLSFRGWGIAGKADCDSDYGPVYYDKKLNEWRDYDSGGHYAIVYYWTDADPERWVDVDIPAAKRTRKSQPNPALDIAWQRVQDAIRNYELIKALT